MDKKKKINMKRVLFVFALLASAFQVSAQDVKEIQFCDKKYEYGEGKDSITLFLKILDSDGNRPQDVTAKDLENYLVIKEDGVIIPDGRRNIQSLTSGMRIPSDYTFSVLVDLSIPEEGKIQICDVVEALVESAADSCVYISFFGDEVTASQLVTKDNYENFKPFFKRSTNNKFFYGALYAKLAEFSPVNAQYENYVKTESGYHKNQDIIKRANANKENNLLFIFTEGNIRPEYEENITFSEVTGYQAGASHIVPRVYAFYYTEEGINESVAATLQGVTTPKTEEGTVLSDRQGAYKPSDNLDQVLENFMQVVKDAMYDFSYTYQATSDKVYSGKTSFSAEWKGAEKGGKVYSIGTAENPWPTHKETSTDVFVKYLIALLVTLLTILFFFFIMKVVIPIVKSKMFTVKYYQKYEGEEGIQRRVCHYCKQEIVPGQMVVKKCKHIMHVHCWIQNGYKCSEYGQNCKTGIQDHVEWNELFTMSAFRDCQQTIMGILAGLVSWVIYELSGRGSFTGMAKSIVNSFFTNEEQMANLYDTCVTKVSAFLTIGFLLGFFLSLIFRYNDEYRKKDVKVYLKIIGLSLLSGVIGLASFAVGAVIFCMLLSAVNTSYIPWYCSLPAYMLFSLCTSLSLTIKSSIPVKSAMIGGLCSAAIGFLVLYFSSITSSRYGWMNMLLDFVIYGGGLGASIVTVRMLAEKYFLIIQNGAKAGQKIPIHKWMNATGGGNKVSIGMTGECEIQMNWEKSNKVAKEHAMLYIDHTKILPMIKPMAPGVIYNDRAELAVNKPSALSNGDTFTIGDTIFQYVENE